MSKTLPFRKAVVRSLATDRLSFLDVYTESTWEKSLYWLDRSGLVLPLAARVVMSSGGQPQVSGSIVQKLGARLHDNEARMSDMLSLFDAVQSLLSSEGIGFCCLKGFSLIHDCYASIRERHQVDFDLLIAPRDLIRAVAILKSLGYEPVRVCPSGETRLVRPWARHLTARSWLYGVSEGPAIELHTRFWEPETDLIDFSIPDGWANGTCVRVVHGVSIRCLAPEWQFLHLLLHVFRHVLDSWVRVLSLYEIAIILRREMANYDLWNKVCNLVQRDAALASACALVLSIVDSEFRVSLPLPLESLLRNHLSRESALWVEHFRDGWLYADPPGTKFALLVQRQFCRDRAAWRAYSLRRLFPFRSRHRLSEEAKIAAKHNLRYRIDELFYQLGRLRYHVASNWNYVCSLARWRRLISSSW
jgi:hypothetical protein